MIIIYVYIYTCDGLDGGKLYRMEETENTDNFRNYLVPI